jgi:hypothetical protein
VDDIGMGGKNAHNDAPELAHTPPGCELLDPKGLTRHHPYVARGYECDVHPQTAERLGQSG